MFLDNANPTFMSFYQPREKKQLLTWQCFLMSFDDPQSDGYMGNIFW
jgi:hypothetical protein